MRKKKSIIMITISVDYTAIFALEKLAQKALVMSFLSFSSRIKTGILA
jgi:hypothetical protein